MSRDHLAGSLRYTLRLALAVVWLWGLCTVAHARYTEVTIGEKIVGGKAPPCSIREA